MKKFSFLVICSALGFTTSVFAQAPKYRALSGALSYATHGSGDMLGTAIEFGYEYGLNKRFSLYNNLGFTFHGQQGLYITSPETAPYFVTAGIQSTPTLLFAVINGKRQKLKIGGGGVARLQINGNPNGYGVRSTPSGDIYTFSESEGVRFNVGYRFGFEYVFLGRPKFDLGFRSFFQNDTNGDALLMIGLQFSRKW
ncbi:MAG: hypothetical protein EAY75_04160 [Bacteroidetes bacterium]|nr:MAG: hypothetical protein EAY75_04160 [Bacteroidota bacterium]